MNIYAFFPLIATVAYLPLLATAASSRPWQRRHTLFVLFLIPAMTWSLIDYLFRSNFFPSFNLFLLDAILIFFAIMAVQYHAFTSSFYGPDWGRWLPLTYGMLAVFIFMVLAGWVTDRIDQAGDQLFPHYKYGIFYLAVFLIVLAGRNFFVLGKRLRTLNNPVLYNQIVSLVIGLTVMTAFALTALLPFGREYPMSHFGNLTNAFILSYAAMRHHLVDIKIVLRRGSAFVVLGLIGAVSYWVLLHVLNYIFDFQINLAAAVAATAAAIVVAAFVYRLRTFLFTAVTRVFQGSSYDHRQKLSEFANTIHNVFSLQEQGGELLTLLTRAIAIRRACLLFPSVGGDDYVTQFAEPQGADNHLADIKLKTDNPIVKYLEREQKPLTRESLAILPEFLGLWQQERDGIRTNEIELFLPLISRGNLIAILVLGKKQSGRYTLEDFNLLADITGRVAVSMEKEYLREQLHEREEELSVINRASAILTSSLDVQEIYPSFIDDLKKVVDVGWAAIVLLEGDELSFLASASATNEPKHGKKVALAGTGSEWAITHCRSVYEPDILKETQFQPVRQYRKWGLRSIVHLPLLVKGEVIGSFIVASRQAHAYSQRNIVLLEHLTAQIAMPVENARLYAVAEERARNDVLTGLNNRRSLDEMIDEEISRHSRYGGVFSLSILDLDSFKTYNDRYGHPAGDRLLRQVGHLIKGAIRDTDHAFRYGGDEFAILFPHTTVEAALQVTERVRKKIAMKVDGGGIKVTASIGLASWPGDGVGHTDIIAAADMTLYRAKSSGGNQINCASGTLLPLEVVASAEEGADGRTLNIIYALAETVDARAFDSNNHLKMVTEYARVLAEALDLKPAEISRLENCALLHDIGKIGISDEILNKPGQLTTAEWATVKTHPQLGAAMVSHVPQLTECIDGIRYHHEHYDGSGYPEGLKGEAIPLEARILSIADAFAAMTSERAYSNTLPTDSALEEIGNGAGKQFDPYLVEKFLAVYQERLTAPRKNTRR